jgi:hypothetical protein
MNKNQLAVQFLALILVLTFAYSCSPKISKSLWVENGIESGIILKEKTTYGFFYTYKDKSELIRKTEKRDINHVLLAGPSVKKFAFNSQNNITREDYSDAGGTPVECEDGYSSVQYDYEYESAKIKSIVKTFYNPEGKAKKIKMGYAKIRFFFNDSDNFPSKILLEDENAKPAIGMWDGISGVSSIKYTILEGVGMMRFGVYYSPDGKIVDRKQISGSTSSSIEYQYYNYNYYYYRR